MENNSKWGVIVCPKGKKKSTAKYWQKVKHAIEAKGIDYDFVQSEKQGGAKRLVKMFIDNGYNTIVIVGGDSALNDAVNCLMAEPEETREKVKIGLIPYGVMNDFASFWELKEGEVENCVEVAAAGKTRKVDVGHIIYNKVGDNGGKQTAYFLNCVNVGLVASLMDMRNRTRHFTGSRTLSILFSFVMMLFKRKEFKMNLKIGTDEVKGRIMTVCVGNARGYGLTPNGVPYNGLLDVSVVSNPIITQLLQGFYLLLNNRILNHRNVKPFRGKKVIVKDAGKSLVGIDGRLIDTPDGEFEIGVEQEKINFIIP